MNRELVSSKEVWEAVAEAVRAYKVPRTNGGICSALTTLESSGGISMAECSREQARFSLKTPSIQAGNGYWWPLTIAGDAKRLAVIAELIEEATPVEPAKLSFKDLKPGEFFNYENTGNDFGSQMMLEPSKYVNAPNVAGSAVPLFYVSKSGRIDWAHPESNMRVYRRTGWDDTGARLTLAEGTIHVNTEEVGPWNQSTPAPFFRGPVRRDALRAGQYFSTHRTHGFVCLAMSGGGCVTPYGTEASLPPQTECYLRRNFNDTGE